MGQYDAVHDLASFHITELLFGDDKRQDGLESGRYDLCYDFIDDVA